MPAIPTPQLAAVAAFTQPASPPPLDTTTTTAALTHSDAVAPRAPQNTPGFEAIPTTYSGQHSSPPPGAVAGIVLGSVGVFLLLLALLYSCTGYAPVFLPWSSSSREPRTVVVEDDNVHHRHRHHKRRHSHRQQRSRRHSSSRTETEMFEVRGAQRVRPVSSSGGRPIHVPVVPTMMPGVRVTQTATRHAPRVPRDDATTTTTMTDETETEDEVVVIEEHSPPRHKSSRRSSGLRSHDSRRDSGRYRRG